MASEMEIYAPKVPVAQQAYELSVRDMVEQVAKIQEVMSAVMVESDPEKGIEGHYGKIPGTPKPTLLKAGAEKLCLLFRLAPEFESVESWDGDHLTVKSRCTLVHVPTGERRGSGEAYCSTKESRYAWRTGKRACPACGSTTIFKSKYPPRGRPKSDPCGWWCSPTKGGCGAEFDHDAPSVLAQNTERVANPDLPDQYNTVLKMANKRSLVAAVLVVTAASDIFTQDIEELPDFERAKPVEPPKERKVASPDEQKAEVLDRIKALLRKHKLMAQAAREERSAALWHAFEVRDLEAVPALDIQALRDGLSVLDAMLTARTMPGDDSVPFEDAEAREVRADAEK